MKFCRYYAKDKTCFYGDECQFLHEDPSMASLPLHGGGSPVPLAMAGGGAAPAGYSLGGSPGPSAAAGPKKSENLGPSAATMEGQLLQSESHTMYQTRPFGGGLTGTLPWASWGIVKIEPGDSLRPSTQTMWVNPVSPPMCSNDRLRC